MTKRTVIDCAGARVGGAARYLREIQTYVASNSNTNIELIGLGRQLTPQWLVQREFQAATAAMRMSINNAGFINPAGVNVTILHNILQFATQDDFDRLRFVPPRRLRAQIPVVRALARASDTLIVPCTRMAEQVAYISPGLQDRLVVRFYPLTQPSWAGTAPKNPRDVLLPIVPSPYKHLDEHIPEFLTAAAKLPGEPIRLIVPAEPHELPNVASHPNVHFIGLQTSEALDQWWQDCAAVFFPPEFEAFGFPPAEARVYGRHVIAQTTAQNQEIAGPALAGYTRYDEPSLRDAIAMAISQTPTPDPAPYDPDSYFHWLLHESSQLQSPVR